MHPLELTLEGFRSYRESATFSFEGRSLFGIVGRTGSGKSSILDALIYALYGKTPIIERATKDLINSEAEIARVNLVFEVDGDVWSVTRALRLKGQSQVVLTKRDDPSAPTSGESNVNQKISDLLGLDFEAFLSSVSLPQGDFDRFLKASPAERSKILKGIFRLDRVDRIKEAAKQRLAEVAGKMQALEAQVDSLPDGPESMLKGLAADLSAAQGRLAEVRVSVTGLSKLETEAQSASERLAEIAARRDEVEALVGLIPPAEKLQEGSDRAEGIEEKHGAAKKSLDVAVLWLEKAEAAVSQAEAATGGAKSIEEGTALLAERTRLDNEAKRIVSEGEESMKAADKIAALVVSATKEADKTSKAVDVASTSLEELNHVHSAHVLRADLKKDEPCPVCEQQVGKLPAKGKAPAIATAREALDKARKADAHSRAALLESEKHHAVAKERVANLAEQTKQSAASLVAVNAALVALFGTGIDANKEIGSRKALLEKAAVALAESRSAKDDADKAERLARAAVDTIKKDIDAYLRALIRVSGALGVDFDGSGGFAELPGAAKKASEAAGAEFEKLHEMAEDVKRRAAGAEQTLREFRVKFEAAEDETVSDVHARVAQSVVAVEKQIESVNEALRRRKEVAVEMKELSARRGLLDRLVGDFTDSRFTKYLLDGERRMLARLGSEKLFELTGHYTFDDEGEFNIIDARTGRKRPSKTLSGGETFLASLSLALALAEAVSLKGGRLGCFFLDEGFGSLDSESLDLALKGVESLVVPGRLIGLISHLHGIQAILDDLIVLDMSPEGATIVVQDGGPLGYGSTMI